MIWRCPEKSANERPKTISAGNDARRLLSDAALLSGLFDIFYDMKERSKPGTPLSSDTFLHALSYALLLRTTI